MSRHQMERSRKQDRSGDKKDLEPAQALKRESTMPGEQEAGEARVSRQMDVEAEKQAAKAQGKRLPRAQGRITHPKTNVSNQYR